MGIAPNGMITNTYYMLQQRSDITVISVLWLRFVFLCHRLHNNKTIFFKQFFVILTGLDAATKLFFKFCFLTKWCLGNITLRYECDETFSDECEFAARAEGE